MVNIYYLIQFSQRPDSTDFSHFRIRAASTWQSMSYRSTGALVQTVACEFLQHTVWGWVIWSWHVRHVRCEGRSNRQTNVQCSKNIMHGITFTQFLITKSKNNSSSHLIRLSWDISELKFSYLKFKLQMRYYCCCMLENICVLLLL